MDTHESNLFFSVNDTAKDKNLPHSTRRALPIALLRAREVIMAQFRPMLGKHGLNEQQWRVIRMLGEYGELDASELAQYALILAPSLTRMIKTLSKNKLIVKRKDKMDGRRLLLSLSARGKELIHQIAPESASIYSDILCKFDPQEYRMLLDLLEAVVLRCSEKTEKIAESDTSI